MGETCSNRCLRHSYLLPLSLAAAGLVLPGACGTVETTSPVSGGASAGGGVCAGVGALAARLDGGKGEGLSIAVDRECDLIVAGVRNAADDLGAGTMGDFGLFITKLDPAGKVLWEKTVGPANGEQHVFAGVDPAGAVLVAGQFPVDVDLGGGPVGGADAGSPTGAVFAGKLGTDGKHVWSRSLESGGVGAATVDSEGRLVVGGRAIVALDSAGAVRWSHSLAGSITLAMAPTRDGHIAVSG